MKMFDLNKVGQRNNRPEYACFLSHLETIKKFANSKYPDNAVALIMEDDATLDYKPYWKTPVSTVIQNAPSDWQILMLGYMFSEGVQIPDLNHFPEYIPNNNIFVSAISYLIRKSTAKKFIDKIYTASQYRLDPNAGSHHADVYLFSNLKTYAYKYPFFTYKTENDSYLHPNDLDNHKRCKLIISKILYGIDFKKNPLPSEIEVKDDLVDGFTDIRSIIPQTVPYTTQLYILTLMFLVGMSALFYVNANPNMRFISNLFSFGKPKTKQYK
jgi:hypothetical protein